MKREDLKALGLADDVIDTIMALHGKGVEAAKTTAAALEAERDQLKAQLAEANTTIEGFKKLDVDSIKAAADEWKAKAEEATKEADARVAQLRFDHALERALADAKAKNTTAVRALLDLDDLKLAEDGTIRHLDDQLKTVREANAYLFESDAPPPPQFVAGGANATVTNDSFLAAMRLGAGLATEEK